MEEFEEEMVLLGYRQVFTESIHTVTIPFTRSDAQ